MLPWRVQDKQTQLWQQFFWAGFFWLTLGGLMGLVILAQQLAPSFLSGSFLLSGGHLQIYAGNLICFGGVYLLLVGFWQLRLRRLRAQAIFDYFPIWELGFWTWNFALAWGCFSALMGRHTQLPFLSFQPEAYGALMVSGSVIAGASTLNLPEEWPSRSPSLLLWLLGLWSLPAALFGFIAIPGAARWFSPSFVQLLLGMGLLLPVLGLLLPLSTKRLFVLDRKRLSGFTWGYILLLPLCVSAFSANTRSSGLILLLQFALLLLFLLCFPALRLWWGTASTFHAMFMDTLPPSFPDNDEEQARYHEQLQKTSKDWHPFIVLGGACLFGVLLSMSAFSLLRMMGYTPSPTWHSNQTYLILGGCVALWLQGIAHLILPQHSNFSAPFAQRQWIAALTGVVLFILGGWFETTLHLHLDLVSIPRGSIVPYFSRGLQLLGGLSTAYAFYLFLRSAVPSIRAIR